MIPYIRSELRNFCTFRDGGPHEMKPLINSLQDFFAQIFSQNKKEVRVFDSMPIRRELFKLHYLKDGEGRFNLNMKADAFEVMDYL